MALQISKTLTGGVVAPECYAKIIETKYLNQPYPTPTTGIRVFVGFYFNAAARTANYEEYVQIQEFTIADVAKETRAEQYTYLKTLPEFAGAIDV
jgi:hypothetical protein